jgi:hypothetical protein
MLHRMPTLNPRLTITLTPAVAAVLKELSTISGSSQSSIVADLLAASLPVFERMTVALRAASTIQETARSEIAAGLDRAQAKLESQMGLLLGDMDEGLRPLLEQAERIERRGRRGGMHAQRAPAMAAPPPLSTPVPVTRGSGHPGKPEVKGRKGGQRGRV